MKKNKITILLVACVLMLTVYYIQMPTDNNVNNPTNDDGNHMVIGESYFASRRAEIVSSRTELFDQLNLIIGNDTSTMQDKEMALSTMNEITTLQEKEIAFEKMIKNLGYNDCLVYANNQVVKIDILTDDFSVEAFVEIAVMAKSHFDRNYVVNIDTVSQNDK